MDLELKTRSGVVFHSFGQRSLLKVSCRIGRGLKEEGVLIAIYKGRLISFGYIYIYMDEQKTNRNVFFMFRALIEMQNSPS